MPPPLNPPRRLMPGMLSASDVTELNRWLEIVYRLALDQPPPVASGSEPPVPFDVPKGFWARIDGEPLADGRHPWREIVPTFVDSGGNINLVWVDYERSASYSIPAYEANGGAVPSGTRVWLQFAPDRGHFLFHHTEPGVADSLPTTEPAEPSLGDLYFNPTTGTINVWNGTVWVITYPDEEGPGNARCENVSWDQYDFRCEENKLYRYWRVVTLSTEEGCPAIDPSPWLKEECILEHVDCCEDSTACCPEGQALPATVTLTVHQGYDACAFMTGEAYTLTYNPTLDRWEGDISGPGLVLLICEGTTWTLELSGDGCVTDGPIAADGSPAPDCDPPCLRWTGVTLANCCEGTVDFRIGCEAAGFDCCPTGETLGNNLTLEFYDATGDCICLGNVELTYDPWLGYHTGSTNACSGATAVILRCDGAQGGFTLELTGSCSTNGPVLETVSNPDRACAPACLLWESVTIQGCCTGTVKARIGCAPLITETCCAEDMPSTLAVTVSSTGPCSGSGTLVYGPTLNWPVFFGNEPANSWQGSVALGDSTMDFWLYCNPDTPTELKLGIANCYVSDGAPGGTCTSPVNLTQVFSNGTCCGADATNYEYTVTITEVP